jgi:membrane protein
MSFRGAWEITSGTFLEWIEDDAPRLAASLAFYTLFSLAPMLIIVIAVVGALYGEDSARERILGQSREFLGASGTEFVELALRNAYDHSKAATVVGMLSLLVGATAVVASLQGALNSIWGVAPKPSWSIWPYVRKRLLSFVVIVSFGGILAASFLASTAIAALNEFATTRNLVAGRALIIADPLISLAVLTAGFGVIYRVLPDAQVAWLDVLLGAISAAVLFTAGKTFIAMYLSKAIGSTFGAAGSLMVFLLWIYYSSQIFLLCAEFTQVYATRRGHGIIPDPHAVRVVKTYMKADS